MSPAAHDAVAPDGSGGVEIASLVPTARTPRMWLRMVLQRPVPAILAAFAVTAAVASPVVQNNELVDGLRPLLWIVPVAAFTWARSRIISGSLAQARASRPCRSALEVRGSAAKPPVWTWNSPLGRACAAAGTAAGTATIGLGAGAVAGAMDGSAPAVAMAFVLGFCALVAGVATWTMLVDIPRGCRHVIRHGIPNPVEALGIEHEQQRWHLQPMDGGHVVVVDAFRGRSRLVAGDVVHLWQAPERADAFDDHRLAITGPFGTLWPSLPSPPSPSARRRPPRRTRIRR